MTFLLDMPIGDADRNGGCLSALGGEVDVHPVKMERHPVVPFDPSPFVELLEDCELSAWAKQAGAKYLISELDALWLLAQALLLDGELSQGSEIRTGAKEVRSATG
jgi:hypothetical protein